MAYGRKNHVNLDPLSYSHCLLGEAKIGKTTLVKNICEKLVGKDGYLLVELGQERGADAIEGAMYINCPEWGMDYDELTNSVGFNDLCEDIVDNKVTEYPDLKILVLDTYDQLINIAENQSIKLWNDECKKSGHPEKRTTSINAAWGGFGKGEKKAIELMFNWKAKLKQVGVETFFIGHVKVKDVNDVASGESYQTLTSDQQQNYFNALKKNLHFLGLAYIDRRIEKKKTGKKNIVTGKEEIINVIKDESRKIKFRDDNYAVDSGSRFENIIDEIPLDADAWIKAVTDAIKAEQSKSGVSIDKVQKEQDDINKKFEERVVKAEQQKKEQKKVDSLTDDIVSFFSSNKTNMNVIKPVLAKIRELGYSNPKEISNFEHAEEVLEMIAQITE